MSSAKYWKSEWALRDSNPPLPYEGLRCIRPLLLPAGLSAFVFLVVLIISYAENHTNFCGNENYFCCAEKHCKSEPFPHWSIKSGRVPRP